MPDATSVWLSGPRQVELRREALPPVGPNDVLVRTSLSAISHGTEMLVYRGQVPEDLALDLPTLAGSFRFPIKYGYASVGRVEEVGAEVTGLRPGDLVFAHHPHQSAYVVPASFPVRLPPGTPPEAGVFLANAETAVNVLLDAHPRYGERVLIFGQGVVGLLVTRLLRRAGAGCIVAVEPWAGRAQAARAAGADVVLPPDEHLGQTVLELTDGQGADLAIEVSGHPAALQQAIDGVAFQGTVVVCSWYGTKPVQLALGGAFHRRRLRLVSSQVSHLDPALEPRWTRERRLAVALDTLETLDATSLISHRVPLEQAADAYTLVDQRAEETVQVVLTYADAHV